MKSSKSERRTSLGEDQFDNLLRIALDSPVLSDWDPDGAMQLWWKAKQCRTVQDTKASPRHPEKDTGTSSSTADESDWTTLLISCKYTYNNMRLEV